MVRGKGKSEEGGEQGIKDQDNYKKGSKATNYIATFRSDCGL